MAAQSLPLIAGAGPVGSAAALFLARGGTRVRLIDKAGEPRAHSRALVVNPRTLSLLEPTGVTERLLALGKPVRGAQFHADGKTLLELSFDTLPGPYPYLLALSQSVTERLLREALAASGVEIERGTELVDCRPTEAGPVDVVLRHGEAEERATVPWLLAADGARSVARTSIEATLPGSTFARDWHLADVPLATDLADDRVHLFLLDGGRFAFVARVVDDGPERTDGPLWRVMANCRDPHERVPGLRPVGPPVWSSLFRIEHRLARPMQVGAVALAGDAAHVHSPVGARGMNLGIEDAWTFAALTLAGRQRDYGRLRRPVDRSVVHRIEAISRLAKGETPVTRLLRRGMPLALRLPALRKRMLATVSGLDHPLPRI